MGRTETSTGDNALRWIGDLDHPFYDDERQRFIWYEASTIAFQLFLFANVALVGFMLWIGGADALPYGVAIMVLQAIAGGIAISYAKARYAEYVPKPSDLKSSRMLVYLGFVLFAATGFVRALLDIDTSTSGDGAADSFLSGAAEGVIAGVISMPIVIGVVIFWKRRKDDAAEELDEV